MFAGFGNGAFMAISSSTTVSLFKVIAASAAAMILGIVFIQASGGFANTLYRSSVNDFSAPLSKTFAAKTTIRTSSYLDSIPSNMHIGTAYTIESEGKFLSQENDGVVWADESRTLNQQWYVETATLGTYLLKNAADNLLLATDKDNLVLSADRTSENVKWRIRETDNENLFVLTSASESIIPISDADDMVVSEDNEQVFAFYDVGAMYGRITEKATNGEQIFANETVFSFDVNGSALSVDAGQLGISENSYEKGQLWQIFYDEHMFASFKNAETGFYLSVENARAFPNANGCLSENESDPTAKWIVEKSSENGFVISSTLWENLYLACDSQRICLSETPFIWNLDDISWKKAGRSSILAERVAQIAEEELASGSHAGGEKYWSVFHKSKEAWCSEFVGWCLLEAGMEKGVNMPSNPTYSGAYVKFYRNHPEYGEVHVNDGTYIPKRGDICIHLDSSGEPCHTELCVGGIEGSKYTDISGNAGDKVSRMKRSFPNGSAGYYISLF